MASELEVGGLTVSGNVGVGTDAGANTKLHISETSTGTPLQITRASNSGNGMIKFETGTQDDWIVGLRNSPTNSDFRFYSYGAGADVITISRSTGLCTFSNGIAFGGQTDATGTGIAVGGTMLDHYERGTFTLTDASGGTGTAPVNPEGHYTRIGNRVFISVSFQMPTQSDGQTMNLAGLPFPVANNEDAVGLVLNYSTISGIVYARTIKATSNIFFYNASGGAVTNATASAGEFYINGHYQV